MLKKKLWWIAPWVPVAWVLLVLLYIEPLKEDLEYYLYIPICVFALFAAFFAYMSQRVYRWKLAKKQDDTKSRCYMAFADIESRGIRYAFHTECMFCTEQTITISVDMQLSAVRAAPPKKLHSHLGAYCPGCGQSASHPKWKNVTSGTLLDLYAFLESRRDVYLIALPTDIARLNSYSHFLETRIVRREKLIDDDKKILAGLRTRVILKEFESAPAGYRESADIEVDDEDATEQATEEARKLFLR